MRAHFEIEPLRTWYYHISPNSRTLVILLQVDLAFGDELESCYEIENTFIFAWSLVFGIRHYHWLHGLIR